jgi:hypothetical protein
MLSINYISNFLYDKQQKIDISNYNKINSFERNKESFEKNKSLSEGKQEELDKYHSNLYNSFDILYDKYIKDFYVDNKIYRNKSSVFTLFNSLLCIIDEYFNLNSEKEKELIIKDFITKIDSDLFQENLYNKYEYNKNRKFNKADIQLVLKDAFQFKSEDKFNLIKEYLSDYLGINIFIFKLEDKLIDFINMEKYLTTQFGKNINKYVPTLLIICENGIHKPIMSHNKDLNGKTSLLTYSNNKEIIDNIWNYLKLDDIYLENINLNNEKKILKEGMNATFIKNLKIDELKKMCIENNIELTKKSDKTSRSINKLKTELVKDLIAVLNI